MEQGRKHAVPPRRAETPRKEFNESVLIASDEAGREVKMTKLLREAFTMASERYGSRQDRLAYLMIENMDRLCEILEEETEEQNFDACVTEAVSSEKMRNIFGKAAKKYSSRDISRV